MSNWAKLQLQLDGGRNPSAKKKKRNGLRAPIAHTTTGTENSHPKKKRKKSKHAAVEGTQTMKKAAVSSVTSKRHVVEGTKSTKKNPSTTDLWDPDRQTDISAYTRDDAEVDGLARHPPRNAAVEAALAEATVRLGSAFQVSSQPRAQRSLRNLT